MRGNNDNYDGDDGHDKNYDDDANNELNGVWITAAALN